MHNKWLHLAALLGVIAVLFSFAACSKLPYSGLIREGLEIDRARWRERHGQTTTTQAASPDETQDPTDPSAQKTDPSEDPAAEQGGTVTICLYPEFAPKTVDHFLSLVNAGYYNGQTFHRVEPSKVALGGDPDDDSGEKIEGEFADNNFPANTLSHQRGVVSMGRFDEDPNSATSHFFICLGDVSAEYDGNRAAFGKVVGGMEIVDGFALVKRSFNSEGEQVAPVLPITILQMEQIVGADEHPYVEMKVSYSSAS